MDEFGVRYCSEKISHHLEAIEDLRLKMSAIPPEPLTYLEVYKLKNALLDIKIMAQMLESDIKDEPSEPPKKHKFTRRK